MLDTIIKVENVKKVYKLYDKPIDRMKEALSLSRKIYHREHFALNDISFNIEKGETIGIVGTNGSGKSTLLKIITGVLNPTEGNLEVKGKISALLELGAGFNPEYTGIENIYLNGTMIGYNKNEVESKIDNILKFADIGEFAYQPVKTYSSGMFARLAFSVAINVEPEILIVDEALSVGDIFFQNKCFKKFDELRGKGVTILFVSHDISSVKQMCSKVLWIENGEQKDFGDAKRVCDNFQNAQFYRMNKENESSVNRMKLDGISKRYSDEKIVIPKITVGEQDILSDKVEIVSFFIRDRFENIVTTVKTGETYEVNILAKIKKDINNAIFGFVAENNKGINILGVNTFLTKNNKIIKCKKDEIMSVVFEVEFPKIAKGEYLLSPAVAEGSQSEHSMLTWLHNNIKIVVDNEGYNLSILDIEADCVIKSYKMDNISFLN